MATLSNDANALRSYRRDVVNVFISHYDRLRLVVEGIMESFASKAFSADMISFSVLVTENDQFSCIFGEFKAGLEICQSISEVQERCKSLTDILEDLGGPVRAVARDLNEKLSSLTGM